MVFNEIAYYPIAGIPLLVYLGMITLILLITTATLGLLVYRGKVKFVFHKLSAILTIISALIHGLLAFGARFIG